MVGKRARRVTCSSPGHKDNKNHTIPTKTIASLSSQFSSNQNAILRRAGICQIELLKIVLGPTLLAPKPLQRHLYHEGLNSNLFIVPTISPFWRVVALLKDSRRKLTKANIL
eukprot:4175461-Amphidinium_carterae.1